MYISRFQRANKVRIEYVSYDQPKKKPVPAVVEVVSEEKPQHQQQQGFRVPKQNDADENSKENASTNHSLLPKKFEKDPNKKLENYTDEELLASQKELNLRKQALTDKKNKINPTSERIKKIHQYNELKVTNPNAPSITPCHFLTTSR